MNVADIILGLIIIFVPIYIYLTTIGNKSGNTVNIVDIIISKITGVPIKKPKRFDNNSSISSVNYDIIDNKPVVNIITNKENVTGINSIYYDPSYIPVDTMSANDIDTTEYSLAYLDNRPDKAWIDYNISKYPSYYSNNIKDGVKSLNGFFDSRNRYHSNPNNKPKRNNNEIGMPQTQYNVLPNGGSAIQPIIGGSIESVNNKEYDSKTYLFDKPMNGSNYFDNVKGVNSIGNKEGLFVNQNINRCIN